MTAMYVSLGTELKVAPKNHTGHDPQPEVTRQVFLNLAIFALGRGKREERSWATVSSSYGVLLALCSCVILGCTLGSIHM